MDDEDEQVTATGTVSASQPKFQATVPYEVRRVLGINDLKKGEEAILEATFELKRIEKKDD